MTTKQKHTLEPWFVGCQNDVTFIIAGEGPSLSGNDYPRHDANRTALARVFDGGDEEPVPEGDANAARIIACVNACAGLSNEALTDMPNGSVLRMITTLTNMGLQNGREANRLATQRDKLLAALRLSSHRLHSADERGPCLCSQCKFVRARDAAIAECGQ